MGGSGISSSSLGSISLNAGTSNPNSVIFQSLSCKSKSCLANSDSFHSANSAVLLSVKAYALAVSKSQSSGTSVMLISCQFRERAASNVPLPAMTTPRCTTKGLRCPNFNRLAAMASRFLFECFLAFAGSSVNCDTAAFLIITNAFRLRFRQV